ncbi:MAG: Smr/MutS family protein [Hydrogenovibrio sp.]|uniref:Smr/MutS family protein n=1 Tax=Hydrogenovibrio sp. TaxID=2065821 RepID=UPI0028705C4C|nr:Smr/MutS family protein [Hydrogenovibrio sp.]MDR9497650.1 Smr/MutS family protein [Hydrogenovibrio sp.]
MSQLTPEDRQAFEQAMSDVTPMSQGHERQPLHETRLKKAAAAKRKTMRRLRQGPSMHADDGFALDSGGLASTRPVTRECTLQFKRPQCDPKTWKKLRQGAFPVDATLDLHGMTVAEAEKAVLQCLQEALFHREKQLLIIHGKGYNAEDTRPKLKNLIHQLLPTCPPVMAFCSAQPKDGGLGSVYVRLSLPR